jgi:hypothetical protein
MDMKILFHDKFYEPDYANDGAGAYVRKPYIKEKLGLAMRKEIERAA